MFLGCLPCCGNICDSPYDVSPASVDIAATFSFFQSERPTHRNNTLAEISHTYTFDGTLQVSAGRDPGSWVADTILGSWQQTVYDIRGNPRIFETNASLSVASRTSYSFIELEFSSGEYFTDVASHFADIVYFPCGGYIGGGHIESTSDRELSVRSLFRNSAISGNRRFLADSNFLAGDINDSWSTQITGGSVDFRRRGRTYTDSSGGDTPDSISLLTEGEMTGIYYYPNYPASSSQAYTTAVLNHSVSVTRFQLVEGNGDHFEPLFNWFGTDYTAQYGS